MPDLLIELLSEEIPARMQRRAAEDLRRLMTDGLVEAGLTYAHAGAYPTPRRLTLALEGLTERSPDTTEERKGPKVGAPDKAVEGFLRGTGLTRDQLDIRDDRKGQTYFAVIPKPGRPASEIVADILARTIRGFPWPKSMRWGAGSLRWVRPLHRILCILTDRDGHRIVPLSIDGIDAADLTEGHRFMAPGPIRVTSFDDYAAKLRRARVILDPAERAGIIRHDAANAAFAQGLEIVDDPALLAEVAGLVEWPVTLMGPIDAAFLDLPPEVLQTSMREHQKFFSVRNPAGRITHFVTVANRETADDGATILAGNQRVLLARLADAKFFWNNDLKVAKDQKMVPWLEKLEFVTFHERLGSQADRIQRIAELATELAPIFHVEPELARLTAKIAKADLASEMVYEFPELQGFMGRTYAIEAGLPMEVAEAIQEHYSPVGPSDVVPSSPLSSLISFSDKLDLLTGLWAADEKPTGSRDPFGARRAALGIIRLITERSIKLSMHKHLMSSIRRHFADEKTPQRLGALASEYERLGEIQSEALREAANISSGPARDALNYQAERLSEEGKELLTEIEFLRTALDEANSAEGEHPGDLLAFLHDRLKVHLRDEGIRYDVIDACLQMPGNDDLTLLVKRARALSDFLKTEDGTNLLQGFKRANNILTQAEAKDGVEYSYGADPKFAETDEERALFAALDSEAPKIETALKDEDFATAMSGLAALRAPIDAFFEAVQINSESQILRRNRLNLLSRIRALCLQVADLTRVTD